MTSERAFDGDRERKRAAGAAAMRRTGISRRVARALTLSFRLPATSAAVAFDPFKEALRRAAGRHLRRHAHGRPRGLYRVGG